MYNDGSRNLDLIQWLRIVVDVGFAVEYLHFGNELRIVHDDLKPSTVLLDEEMNGHVGDFGLSMLFQILKKQFSCNKANHRLHSFKYVNFFFILLNYLFYFLQPSFSLKFILATEFELGSSFFFIKIHFLLHNFFLLDISE